MDAESPSSQAGSAAEWQRRDSADAIRPRRHGATVAVSVVIQGPGETLFVGTTIPPLQAHARAHPHESSKGHRRREELGERRRGNGVALCSRQEGESTVAADERVHPGGNAVPHGVANTADVDESSPLKATGASSSHKPLMQSPREVTSAFTSDDAGERVDWNGMKGEGEGEGEGEVMPELSRDGEGHMEHGHHGMLYGGGDSRSPAPAPAPAGAGAGAGAAECTGITGAVTSSSSSCCIVSACSSSSSSICCSSGSGSGSHTSDCASQQAQQKQKQGEDDGVVRRQDRRSRALKPIDKNKDLSPTAESDSEAETNRVACRLPLPAVSSGWPFGLPSSCSPPTHTHTSPRADTHVRSVTSATAAVANLCVRSSNQRSKDATSSRSGNRSIISGIKCRCSRNPAMDERDSACSECGGDDADCEPIRDCHVNEDKSEGSPTSGRQLGLSASAGADLCLCGAMVGDGNTTRVYSNGVAHHHNNSSREEAHSGEPLLLSECVKAVSRQACWRLCTQGRADEDEDDDDDDESEEGGRSESTDYGDDMSDRGDRQGGALCDLEPVTEGIELISTERGSEEEGERVRESVVLDVQDCEEASVGECESVCESLCESVWSTRTGGESVNDGEAAEGRGKKSDVPLLSLVFAPGSPDQSSSTADASHFQAVHVILPPPRLLSQDVWGDGGILADVSGMEAIFDPARVRSFRARKQLFLALVLIGALLYVVAFVAGLLTSYEFEPVGTPPSSTAPNSPPSESSSSSSSSSSDSDSDTDTVLDFFSRIMLTSNNAWVALAFLVLYLSLDMIGFAGALLENSSLLALYIVVEVAILLISALDSLQPFLFYRLAIILLAIYVRMGTLAVEAAERRLIARLTGRELLPPPPSSNTLLARLGIIPRRALSFLRPPPVSRFHFARQPWYSDLVTAHQLRLAHIQMQMQSQAQMQQEVQRDAQGDALTGAEAPTPGAGPAAGVGEGRDVESGHAWRQ